MGAVGVRARKTQAQLARRLGDRLRLARGGERTWLFQLVVEVLPGDFREGTANGGSSRPCLREGVH